MNIFCTGLDGPDTVRRVQVHEVVPPTPTTSLRLARAAAAERAELARHRDRLLAARRRFRDELDRIEASLAELDDRDALLSRFTPEEGTLAVTQNASPSQTRQGGPIPEGGWLLRGPAIRHTAVRVLLDHPERPEALHYRRWYGLLTDAGYTVAGKDPLAVFLTQVSRSPVIKRGTQTGVYGVDPQAPRRLRQRLDELHAELRSLASTPNLTADLAAIRERRSEIIAETGRTERALEEAERLLAPIGDLQRAVG